MKLILSIFLFLNISIVGISQVQFFEESANWKHRVSAMGPSGFVETENTNIDTTISDNSYLIFNRTFYLEFSGYETDTINDFLYLREDQNKIYQYDTDDEVERKLVDFNLNVGDTIDFMDLRYYSNDNAIVTVSSKGLDTIQDVELNFLTINIKVNGLTFGARYYEKIGPTFQNLLVNEAVDLFGDAPLHRLCSYSSASGLHYESDGVHCSTLNNFISSSNEIENDLVIIISPNPNEGSFYIETNSTKKLNYKLSDIRGGLILEGETSEPKTLIELSNIASNLYFLTLESANQIEVRKVFISK